MVNHKVILDVDPGIDDAICIMIALQSIDIEVVGISTVNGNIGSRVGALNALKILHALDRSDIPVLQGATKPLLKKKIVRSEYVHGKGGLGGLQLELPKHKKITKIKLSDFIEETIKNYKKAEVSIIATGPLTNIAKLFIDDSSSSILNNLGDICIMGGAFGLDNKTFGGFTKYAEFNFYCDPEAAKIVLDKNQNLNVNRKVVSLDVTSNPLCGIEPEFVRQMKENKNTTPKRKIITSLLDYAISKRNICNLHDVFALAMLKEKTLFKLKKGRIEVILNGRMRGHSKFIEDDVSPNGVMVASNVNEKKFTNFLFASLLKD
jgi:inosine-uridine nucleoside N-ribohydrolase